MCLCIEIIQVETIGDAYMAVSGLPTSNGDKHVVEICQMALALVSSVKTFRVRHKADHQLQLRIGIHSGKLMYNFIHSEITKSKSILIFTILAYINIWVFYRPMCGRCGWIDYAPILSVRRHGQHCIQDGKQWRT